MSLNPSTWSAKAQALGVALLTIAVAWANQRWNLGIDPKTILGVGASGTAAVAVIDHGEPPGAGTTPAVNVAAPAPVVPSYSPVSLTDAERSILDACPSLKSKLAPFVAT